MSETPRREEQTVYVVMGNDYPDAVFVRKEDAEAYIKEKKGGAARDPRIYWQAYKFELR